MASLNIYFDEEEDNKLYRLKKKFKLQSKTAVVKKLVKDYGEDNDGGLI